MKKETKRYIIGILIPILVGAFASFLTRGNMDIFDTIEKPALTPPEIVFPIVWTVLYTLMGIGSTIIYNSDKTNQKQRSESLFYYGLQLFVNFLWSIIFFNLKNFLFSFIVIIVLWILILVMILKFSKVKKIAAYLQIPYILWVTFAGYLNLMIYILNH